MVSITHLVYYHLFTLSLISIPSLYILLQATTPPVRPVYRDSSPVGTIMDSPTGPQVVMMHDFSINVLQKLGQTDLSGSTSGNIFRSHASSPSLSNSIAFGSSEYPSCNLTGEVELERSLTGTDEASDFSPHKLHYNVQYTGDLNSSILSFSEEGHPQVDTKDYHGTAVLMTIKYDKIVKKVSSLSAPTFSFIFSYFAFLSSV